jgi:prepilin-type processing-associated H-X9-DG protein
MDGPMSGEGYRGAQDQWTERRSAFTRTELVVVLAMLGAMVFVFLPALPHREHSGPARDELCVNNLRRLGEAVSLFATERGQYPASHEWVISAGGSPGPLAPYGAGSYEVFICPEKKCAVRGERPAERGALFSYGYNGAGAATNGVDVELGMGRAKGIAQSEIKVPSAMIIAGDSGNVRLWSYWLSPNEDLGLKDMGATDPQLPSQRHDGGANILFCDGHVVYGKQDKWIEKTFESRGQWNNDNQPHPETW